MENTEIGTPQPSFHESFIKHTSPVPATGLPAGYEIRHADTPLRSAYSQAPTSAIEVLYLVKHATAGAPEWLTYRAAIRNEHIKRSLQQGLGELTNAARHHLAHGILPGNQRFAPITYEMLPPR